MTNPSHQVRSSLDAFLLRRTPPWYRTPLAQTTTLGLIFFCVFAAYTTIQFYAASTYGPDLASDLLVSVYVSLTVACSFSPSVTNKLGVRATMLLGICGYAALVLCSLLYFLRGGGEGQGDKGDEESNSGNGNGNGNVVWARLVVAGGAVLGCGAALLWTAQGRLVLQYAAVDENERGGSSSASVSASLADVVDSGSKRSDSYRNSTTGKKKTGSGTLMGIFWAVFQCSSLVGGSISFFYYNRPRPSGSVMLYVVFLGFVLLGAVATQFLLPPAKLRRKSSEDDLQLVTPSCYSEEASLISAPSTSSDAHKQKPTTPLDVESTPQEGDNTGCDSSSDSWTAEAIATAQLFFADPRMARLSVLFLYTGFNQPYQQATFGNRFFSRRSIGVELIIFHLMEIIGAIYCGRALDSEAMEVRMEGDDGSGLLTGNAKKNIGGSTTRTSSRQRSAVRYLFLFFIVNSIGNVLAFFEEYKALVDGVQAFDITDSRSFFPSLVFACWGFADSQIQVYCYYLIGTLYSLGADHSRAVGFYKCVQSLGVSLGFFFIPLDRLSAMSQLLLSSGVFIIGTALSFLELPR